MSIEEKLKTYIAEPLYKHSIDTRDTAVKLAGIYGCSIEKAGIAALLHDVARDCSVEEMKRIIEEDSSSGSLPDGACMNPLLLHAPAGRIIAKKQFGIDDEEILRSIELHTTGGSSMSMLNKIVFVADFTEPGRSFRGVKTARRLALRDLNAAVVFIFRFLLQNLLREERSICEDTFHAYNELILLR